MQKKAVTPLCIMQYAWSCLQLMMSLMQEAASHEAAIREERSAPRSRHVSTSNASLVADGVAEIVKRSARHAQDPPAKKGSSTSKPALAETSQHDVGRGPRMVCCSGSCIMPFFALSAISMIYVCLSVCRQCDVCLFACVFACRICL